MVTLLENGRSIIVFDPHFQSCHWGAQGDQEKENHSHFHFPLNQISSATHIWFESVDQSHWSRNWSWRCILKTGDKLSGEGLWLSHFGARGYLVGGRRGGHCRYLGFVFSRTPSCGSGANFGVGVTLWCGVGEICRWWWRWGRSPPPPQTTLSSSPHSSVDIMYRAVTLHCVYCTVYTVCSMCSR